MEYGDKHILVLGAGASGIGASWVLAQVGAHVVLNDYKPMTLPTAEEKRLVAAGRFRDQDNTWTAFHCRDLRYSYGRTPSGKYSASVSRVCSECCVYFIADDTGLSQCDHVQSFHLCAGISAASGL